MELSSKQKAILGTSGHLLVTGGPGSGKTTVSILKAAQIAEHDLRPGQEVLFLSFARATVARVIEAMRYEQKIHRELRERVCVDTYHSLFWRILKTHGYLIGLPRKLSVLVPSGEGVALASIRNEYERDSKLTDEMRNEKRAREDAERRRLAFADGQVCFDLFAPYVADILHGSKRVSRLIATKYPVVMLDEFQDTNAEQWRAVQAFGQFSTLLALADPEQRIYDWIGADPERLKHFTTAFNPITVDLSSDNYRSAGTEIALFGNDLLRGTFQKESYRGVSISGYPPNEGQAMTALVSAVYAARKRLLSTGCKDWSVAVLVPTKKMTRLVSDALRSPPAGMTPVGHTAAIDLEGAILGAEVVAFLMQPDTGASRTETLIAMVCNYFCGRGGDNPTKKDLNEAASLRKAYQDSVARASSGKPLNKKSILVAFLAVCEAARGLAMTGDPDVDWLAIRGIIEKGECPRLQGLAEEVRNIRVLGRGARLRQALSHSWLENGAYVDALAIVRQAFVQEHFSTGGEA